MSRKKSLKDQNQKWHHVLEPETKRSIWAIIFFAVALVFTLAAFGKAGLVGGTLYALFNTFFGEAFFLIPVVFILMAFSFLFALKDKILAATIIGAVLFLLSSLGLTEAIFGEKTGGYVGFLTAYPLQKLFDFWAALIIFSSLIIVSLLMMLNVPLRLSWIWRRAKEEKEEELKINQIYLEGSTPIKKETSEISKPEIMTAEKEKIKEDSKTGWLPKFSWRLAKKSDLASLSQIPLELLEGDRGKPAGGDIKANSNIIKRTLQNFGIDVEMGEVSIGPSITQYSLRPAEGMKLSKILALQNDLALALAAHPIRIEAPIPGKSLVGIEIPNRAIATVGLKNLLSTEEWRNSLTSLFLALGRNVSGHPIYADLAKMPHLLIAGSTGAGKSVFLHSLIINLLYQNNPDQLKFLLIDPKRVELPAYEDIPHLLSPVIIDAKKAILALRWAAKEMERRYDILSSHKMRDIASYHEKISGDEKADFLPFIVIVIDELADIMAAYPRELESAIVRLAQMSRAVGIHLIISTQRPEVSVITGLIKANIPTRIALRAASQTDSRTILDAAGAEKLLGNGDMLYLSGDASKPVRVQGVFVTAKEVKRVVEYLKKEYEDFGEEKEVNFENNKVKDVSAVFDELKPISIFDEMEDEKEEDELYEQAREIVVQAKRASTSYLQRRLRLGYARAARLMDVLEEKGVVGPADGAKPREVLIKNTSSDAESDNQKLLNEFKN
ncbi:MAG: DNA translocase FtsK 4TM domain-containing protein [Candidatus Niyogibacteria bacterium]|nr:DNA translocase FtsK 4TM domain-containing protein [Candidatus Niyogibacteria bacterium]